MAKLTFKGGIHPFDGKDLSKNKPIVDADATDIMIYPLSQHIGAPANPIVSVGDRVLGNQKIAEANGFVSANIHSSVSGIVKAIEPRRVVGGQMAMSIVIENDHLYEMAPQYNVPHIAALTKEDVLLEAGAENIDMVMQRVFARYYKICEHNKCTPSYQVGNMR